MNRIRKPLYQEVSRYRRSMNGEQALCEPKDWNVDDPASCELSLAKILAVHGMRNLGRSRTLAVR